MKLRRYCRDHLLSILLHLFSGVLLVMLLDVMGVRGYALGFLIAVAALTDLVCFFLQYHKRRVYYRELYHKLEHLDHKYLLAEMLDKPEFSDGAVLYDVLHQVSKSMNDTLADYRRKNTDYREYIETWVHEIKTPIASSRLMLENNKGPLSRTLGAELSKIENYVEQALFYTRSSSVEKDYIIKRVDLKELVSGVVKKNAMPLIEAKVSVELCELEQEVFTDSKWLDFILGQLISNAVKYRSDQPKLKISAEPRSQSVLLRLSDNGIGIPEQDINRVFEKGFTGENGRKYNRSTGIGLYLCKKLCDQLGLTISISSQLGVGTDVYILFPKSKTFLLEDQQR